LFLRRLFRYAVCLIISTVLLIVILPHAGVDQAHFLPPSWSYKKADGTTSGAITKTYSVQTDNPFYIGKRIYFWDYTFYAKTIPPGKTKPVMQQYNGEVRIDKDSFDKRQQNDTVLVRYVQSYPWINGLDSPQIGQGCGEGSNIMSGWLIWVGVSALVAFVFLGIMQYFLPKEDL